MRSILSFLFLINLIEIFYALQCPIYPSKHINSQQYSLIKTCDTNCTFSYSTDQPSGCLGLYYNHSGDLFIQQLNVIYSDAQCFKAKYCILEIDSLAPQLLSCCCSTDNCTLHWRSASTTTQRSTLRRNATVIENIINITDEDQFSWKVFLLTLILLGMIIILIIFLFGQYRSKYLYEDKKLLSTSMDNLFFSAQEINIGKNSLIYKAIFQHDIVALKVYNQTNMLVWKNEVSILKSIQHESIVKILSEGQYDSHLYIVLPFYENGTLQSYLRTSTRKLSMNQCLIFLRSLASAISYLHMGRNNTHMTIIHRDIKSSNILIDKNGLNLYLTDFGVAMGLPQLLTDRDFVQIGTIRYMAPELLEGVIAHTSEALCNVDMYALALVMWEIITQCETYPVTEYNLPYEEYRKNDSNGSSFASEIYEIVVVRRLRPTLIRPLKDNPHSLIMNELCSLIDACWITDSDIRMNAQTLAFKLNQHV